MSSRSVTSLPLSESSINLLQNAGFYTVDSLAGLKPLELSKELNCSQEEAASIYRSLQYSSDTIKSWTAKDFLSRRDVGRPIITFCKSLDEMMGGGVPISQITEFVGVPGIGKTQIAMQLAINAQIPEIFGGNGSESIYIDTEGSFMVERAADMAEALSTHLVKMAKSKSSNHPESSAELVSAAGNMTRNRLLEGIYVYRVHDQTELLAVVSQLPSFLKTHTRIRLVVIDSIAFHFRQSLQDNATRIRILTGLSQSLNQIADQSNLAIVVTNHVTTRFQQIQTSDNGGSSHPQIVPALGELWSHCVTNRVLLSWTSKYSETGELMMERTAEILKSPCWQMARTHYVICSSGVRGVSVSKVNPQQICEQNIERINPNYQRQVRPRLDVK